MFSIHILFMPTILDLLTKHKCWEPIDLLHTTHNAPVPFPTMHQFVTGMCTILLQNHVSWVISLVHCGNFEKGQFIHNSTLQQLLLLKNQGLTVILDRMICSHWWHFIQKQLRICTCDIFVVSRFQLRFSEWNYIENVNGSQRPASVFYVTPK